MDKLPAILTARVACQLDAQNFVRLRQVSRAWKKAVQQDEVLWAFLVRYWNEFPEFHHYAQKDLRRQDNLCHMFDAALARRINSARGWVKQINFP